MQIDNDLDRKRGNCWDFLGIPCEKEYLKLKQRSLPFENHSTNSLIKFSIQILSISSWDLTQLLENSFKLSFVIWKSVT